MKRQLLFVLAFFCLTGAIAQPTLQNIEHYQPGMKFANWLVDSTAVITDVKGANVTWNYATLLVTTDTVGTDIVDADSSSFGNAYPAATYIMMSTDATVSVMKDTANTNQLLALITNTGISMDYSNAYTSIRRPFTYLDSLTDIAAHSYAAGPETLAGTGATKTVADGWGTLILPGHTYNNVLRVNYQQQYSDTGSMSGTVTDLIIRTKCWYDADHISPLMTVDTIIISNPFFADTFATVTVLKWETIPTGINEHGALPASKLYYADGSLYLQGDLKQKDKITVQAYDIAGRKVKENAETIKGDMKRYKLSLSELNDSMYYTVKVMIERGSAVYTDAIKMTK